MLTIFINNLQKQRMTKLPLIIVFSLLIQGCSALGGSLMIGNSERITAKKTSVISSPAKNKERIPDNIAAMTEFLVMMNTLKKLSG